MSVCYIVVPKARHAGCLAIAGRRVAAHNRKPLEGSLVGAWCNQSIFSKSISREKGIRTRHLMIEPDVVLIHIVRKWAHRQKVVRNLQSWCWQGERSSIQNFPGNRVDAICRNDV